MTAIIDLLRSFWRLFIWWVVVMPWELAIRVRLGKQRQRLGPGLSFRIPYADVIFKQSVRLRFATTMPQTVSTRDGFTLTVSGQLGYTIVDIDKLYDTLQQGENALRAMAQGAIARYVFDHNLGDCAPAQIEIGVARMLQLGDCGLEYHTLQLTTFCRVKTYRLIMDTHENAWEDLLNTRLPDSQGLALK